MHLVLGHAHVAVLRRFRRFRRGDLGGRDSAAEHPGYRDEERRADAGQHRRARLRLEVAGLRSLAGPAGGGFMGKRHLESAAKTIWQYCVRLPIKVLPASRQCTHPASGATKIAGHGAQPSDGVPLAGIDSVAAFLPYSCKFCINAAGVSAGAVPATQLERVPLDHGLGARTLLRLIRNCVSPVSWHEAGSCSLALRRDFRAIALHCVRDTRRKPARSWA